MFQIWVNDPDVLAALTGDDDLTGERGYDDEDDPGYCTPPD